MKQQVCNRNASRLGPAEAVALGNYRRPQLSNRISQDGMSTVTRTRVLLADDRKDILERAVDLLSPEYDVVGTVCDGQALIEAVHASKPDVLVLDISMPVLNGIEAASRLRKNGSRAKLVFLTVHEDEDYVIAAHAIGALGYVTKLRMSTDLTVAIEEALKGQCFTSPFGVGQIV